MKVAERTKSSGALLGRLLIALTIGTTSILVVIFLSGSGKVLARVFGANLETVLLLLIASFSVISVDSIRTYILSRSLGKRLGFFKALENSVFGFYVSAITPFSAGGQPFQIYHLVRNGLSVEEASAIVGVKFITSFTVSISFGLFALLLYSDEMISIPGVGKVMYFGVALTVAMYFFFSALALGGRFTKAVISSKPVKMVMSFLLRKKGEVLEKAIEEKVKGYTETIRGFFRSHPLAFTLNAILTVVMIILILTTPYLAIVAVSDAEMGYLEVMGLQIAMNLVVYFLPTPGASGGVEGMFYVVFSHFVDKETVASALVIWRFFTYYLTIIFGNVMASRYLKSSGSNR